MQGVRDAICPYRVGRVLMMQSRQALRWYLQDQLMEVTMSQTIVQMAGAEPGMNFNIATARGIDRLIAVSHHAQQKVCATVLQSSLIEHLLERPELDVAMVRELLTRIMAVSYSAAEAVSELQELVIEHLGGQDDTVVSLQRNAQAA